jgi:hypothetical protein
MKRVWVKKSGSFKSAEQFNINYYLLMSPAERLKTVQFLREIAFKIKKGSRYGKNRKRLRRVIKIVQ